MGKGHNPEAFRLKDGRVVVYVIDGYYIADGVDSKVWTYGKFSFDSRDRKIIEGLSNLTFARRQDDSYLMVCRGGGVWISKDGLSPYMQSVSYTHLRAHETGRNLVCRLLLEKKKIISDKPVSYYV